MPVTQPAAALSQSRPGELDVAVATSTADCPGSRVTAFPRSARVGRGGWAGVAALPARHVEGGRSAARDYCRSAATTATTGVTAAATAATAT